MYSLWRIGGLMGMAGGLLCLAGVAAAEPFAVELKNPSFDGAMAGRVPAGWSLYAGAGREQTFRLVEPAFGKGQAVLLDDRDAEHEIGLTQDVAAPGGQAYEVAVDIAAVPEAPPPANLYVQMRFLPSNTYAQEVLHTRQTAAFETIVLRGAMPAGDTTIRLYLYTHKGTAWTTALLDNVRLTGGVPAPAEPAALPSMKAPVVTQLKDAHLTTALVSAGRPAAGIVVASGRYAAAVAALQAAVRSRTGVELPVWSDRDAEAALPLRGARILLGNRSTNQAIGGLYDACFTLLDLKYPGPGGAVVHSLHNPYANGHNAILVGGSDDAGVERAAGLLAERLSAAPAGDALALGWVLDVRLPEGVVLPEDARHAETWDASDGYGSTGYFGWSSLSKCMAMYFMTGEPRHAREFVRLAFPDAQALKEISDIDGERIENKDDPLAGAYHYNQHMTLLYWDLIEESPVFSDDERLRITNGLARQLEHPDYAREGIFRLRGPAEAVSSRHGQWAAIGLLCLGRYFNRYYPDPVWEQCEQAGRWAFESLHKHAWVNGESDNLYWYSTGIAPIFTYLCLTGDREPLRQGTLAELLRGQEILLNGLPGDRQLQYAALTFLHQAAYLTGDGRWVGYRERTAMDTRIFRLGQSYWPDESLSPVAPADLCGRWSIQPLPVPQWSRRGSGLTSDESFAFGSFRTETGPGGDFVLIDGFNGASRNPYHTFAILDLRLAGSTLLQGYLNQVLTKADGMVEPAVAMDAGLRWAERLGGTAGVSARVPRAAYCTWQRTLLQRLGRYALVIDDLAFRESSENMAVQTLWETRGGRWQAEQDRARLTPRQGPRVPPGWMEFRALDAACTTQPADPGRLGRLTGVGIVLLRAQAPGEWLEMPFELEKPFAGEAYLDTVRYNDRGVVRVLIDGQAVQDRLNLYAGEARDERLSLGAVSLAAGRHVLRLEVVGHDESSARFFAALGALLLRPEGAAAEPAAPAVAYALSTADPLDVRGDATLTMAWNGPAEAGTNRLFFHLLSPDDAEAAGSFCRRLSPNAAFLRLPEPALAVVGAAEGVQAEVAILAADHLYGRGLTRAGLGPLLVSSEAPVAVDWDFATGEAALAVSAATTLTLALAEPGALRLDGQPVAALPLALPAGEHRLTGARPSAAVLSALRAGLDAAGTQSAGLWDEAKAARTRAATLPPSAALTVAPMASLPQGATEIIELPGLDQSPWLAVAEGSTVHLLTAAGAPVRTLQADGRVRVLAWWPEADALLVGCADEKLIAFARDGARRWVFTSEMDPAVFRAAKTYWFKSAPGHEGIHGLVTGPFIDGRSQCLVGSACTVEIVNPDGSLAQRLAAFWGPGKIMRLVPTADGGQEATIARWPNGTDELSLIDSRDLKVRRGFYGVPSGHTMVSGWSAQNRVDLIWEDVDADGAIELVTAINGTWNRVTVYGRDGRPRSNAPFGPGGNNNPRAYLRDLKTAPWGEAGRRVILTATHEGLVVALDHECRRLWSRSLPSAPRRLCLAGEGARRVLVGCDDGTLVALDESGRIVAGGRAPARVEHLIGLEGGAVLAADAKGALLRVALP